jgi:hypothetical protein
LSADILDYYADNGEVFLADKVLDPEHGEAIIQIVLLALYWCDALNFLSTK